MQADLASWIQWGCWQWDQWTYQSHREDSKFHRTGLHMKGKCLNQGGLSSWLQISSANHVVVCFVLNSEACIFLHRDYRKLLLVCFLSFFCFFPRKGIIRLQCQSGQQWRFAPGVLLVVVVLCVVCVYIIYIGGPIEFIWSWFFSCFVSK